MAFPSHDFRLMKRFSEAYRAYGFSSQAEAAELARTLGIAEITQPLISDYLMAVEREESGRGMRQPKREALLVFTEALERAVDERVEVAPGHAHGIVGEIRAKLDELERILPTLPVGDAREAWDAQRALDRAEAAEKRRRGERRNGGGGEAGKNG